MEQKTRTKKRWTEDEVEFLRKNWGVLKPKEIARKLDISVTRVHKKATRMELKMTDEQYERITGKTRWTKEKRDYIIENYNKKTIEEIMETLGIDNEGVVRRQASLIGAAEKGHIWTEEEEEYLIENWGSKPISIMAKNLGISYEAVRQKADKLKVGNQLYYNGDYYTVKELAEVLGVGSSTVYGWLNARVIKPRKLKVGKTFRYQISYKNIIKFLREEQNKYDTRKCDMVTIKAMVADYRIRVNGNIEVGDLPNWLQLKIEKDKLRPLTSKPREWTIKEEQKAIEMYKMGKTVLEISMNLNRTFDSVMGKIRKLVE